MSELFFRIFPAKIPAKRGKIPANRVASRSWSCSLSCAPGLVDQLAVSQKEFVHKGGCLERKRVRFSARFPYFSSAFTHTVDVAPDVGFQRSWCHWKDCATLFLKVLDLWETELGLKRYGPVNRGHRSVFGSLEGNFPIKIPARPGKILVIRELHVMSKRVLFLKVMGLRITLQ